MDLASLSRQQLERLEHQTGDWGRYQWISEQQRAQFNELHSAIKAELNRRAAAEHAAAAQAHEGATEPQSATSGGSGNGDKGNGDGPHDGGNGGGPGAPGGSGNGGDGGTGGPNNPGGGGPSEADFARYRDMYNNDYERWSNLPEEVKNDPRSRPPYSGDAHGVADRDPSVEVPSEPAPTAETATSESPDQPQPQTGASGSPTEEDFARYRELYNIDPSAWHRLPAEIRNDPRSRPPYSGEPGAFAEEDQRVEVPAVPSPSSGGRMISIKNIKVLADWLRIYVPRGKAAEFYKKLAALLDAMPGETTVTLDEFLDAIRDSAHATFGDAEAATTLARKMRTRANELQDGRPTHRRNTDLLGPTDPNLSAPGETDVLLKDILESFLYQAPLAPSGARPAGQPSGPASPPPPATPTGQAPPADTASGAHEGRPPSSPTEPSSADPAHVRPSTSEAPPGPSLEDLRRKAADAKAAFDHVVSEGREDQAEEASERYHNALMNYFEALEKAQMSGDQATRELRNVSDHITDLSFLYMETGIDNSDVLDAAFTSFDRLVAQSEGSSQPPTVSNGAARMIELVVDLQRVAAARGEIAKYEDLKNLRTFLEQKLLEALARENQTRPPVAPAPPTPAPTDPVSAALALEAAREVRDGAEKSFARAMIERVTLEEEHALRQEYLDAVQGYRQAADNAREVAMSLMEHVEEYVKGGRPDPELLDSWLKQYSELCRQLDPNPQNSPPSSVVDGAARMVAAVSNIIELAENLSPRLSQAQIDGLRRVQGFLSHKVADETASAQRGNEQSRRVGTASVPPAQPQPTLTTQEAISTGERIADLRRARDAAAKAANDALARRIHDVAAVKQYENAQRAYQNAILNTGPTVRVLVQRIINLVHGALTSGIRGPKAIEGLERLLKAFAEIRDPREPGAGDPTLGQSLLAAADAIGDLIRARPNDPNVNSLSKIQKFLIETGTAELAKEHASPAGPALPDDADTN